MKNDSNIKVDMVDKRVGFDGFFKVSVYDIKHEKFDGSMSEVMTREIFERGESVGVLPYDPARNEVLLIRQFLPGAYIACKPPRPLQVIAGMVEDGEIPSEVASRESHEEAGIEISDVIPAIGFLTSPGGTSEFVHTFLTITDLSSASGIHGLASENEDIRVEVMDADDAIGLLDSGEITASIAVVLLSWFARNKDEIDLTYEFEKEFEKGCDNV